MFNAVFTNTKHESMLVLLKAHFILLEKDEKKKNSSLIIIPNSFLHMLVQAPWDVAWVRKIPSKRSIQQERCKICDKESVQVLFLFLKGVDNVLIDWWAHRGCCLADQHTGSISNLKTCDKDWGLGHKPGWANEKFCFEPSALRCT